jgi:hypothetical protein
MFLESAAADLGRPELAAHAGRIVPLTALANLCAQAALAPESHAPGILAGAAEFRDQIAIALQAAERMLAEVEAGRARLSDEPLADALALSIIPPAHDSRKPRRPREI